MIEIRNLTKYYVRGDQIIPVLVDINLDVRTEMDPGFGNELIRQDLAELLDDDGRPLTMKAFPRSGRLERWSKVIAEWHEWFPSWSNQRVDSIGQHERGHRERWKSCSPRPAVINRGNHWGCCSLQVTSRDINAAVAFDWCSCGMSIASAFSGAEQHLSGVRHRRIAVLQPAFPTLVVSA